MIKEKDLLELIYGDLIPLTRKKCSVENCQNVADYEINGYVESNKDDVSASYYFVNEKYIKEIRGYACEFHRTKLKKDLE